MIPSSCCPPWQHDETPTKLTGGQDGPAALTPADAIDDFDGKSMIDTPASKRIATVHPLNQILYGPPGTGKTWNTARIAVEICNGSAPDVRDELMVTYRDLVSANRIAFTTFHQSIGYEEFVEGLRPTTDGEGESDESQSGGFRLEPCNGIFRDICALAEQARKRGRRQGDFNFTDRKFFKMSLGQARTETHVYDAAIAGNYIVLGWGGNVDWSDPKYNEYRAVFDRWQEEKPGTSGKSGDISQVWCFRSSMKKGDIVIVSEGNLRFRAIGEVIGEYEFDPLRDGWHHRRAVKWLTKLDKSLPIETIYDGRLSQASCYLLTNDKMKLGALTEQIATGPVVPLGPPEAFVLIIDEINRANVSKVLGELITLLETDKRLGERNALTVKLPYSNDDFGVPNNLYVIGTMNTADRSIALLDTALRRRFHFTEMMPDYSCLDRKVDEIHLGNLLKAINRRVEWLFDRDHQIGHSFFIELTNKTALDDAMRRKIVPLLAEYFYEDWAKVRVALNDSGGWFIATESLSVPPMLREEGEVRSRYSINFGDIPIDAYVAAASDE
ncbi:MAG: AAA family ATPase [Aliidongia sp.]